MFGLPYLRLIFKGSGRAVGFDLAYIGDVQFLRNVLVRFAEQFPNDLIWMFHHNDTAAEFEERVPEVKGRISHVPYRRLWEPWFKKLDLYVTTEQCVPGPVGVYTLTLSHGQPAKGSAFLVPNTGSSPPHDVLAANDALFLYGPLYREALEEHLAIKGLSLPPHLSLFDIGYTKSDDLLAGRFDREDYLKAAGLDPNKKTILYAPAFNDGASMRECGVAVLDALCAMGDYNVLAKLPGMDEGWFKTCGNLERTHPNFRLVRDPAADPAMASSDVTVTCVSGIGWEFLALGKPVIYIGMPQFWTRHLPRVLPEVDPLWWASHTVTDGRRFGLVVSRPDELPQAVAEVLAHPEKYPKDKARLLDYLLYNPGKATEAAVEQMDRLLRQRVRSQRAPAKARALLHSMTGYRPLRTKIKQRLRSLVLSEAKAVANVMLNRFGYVITKPGLSYLDAKSTVAAARAKGLSVCDYCESLDDNPRVRGRRDRIIARLERVGVFDTVSRACEIGAGTGMYLEKVIELAQPQLYEVYETDLGWAEFLASEYGHRANMRLVCHPADGCSLRFTTSNSVDLVHAHGLLVALPLLHILSYLKECVRVCCPGGYIAFDCHLDSTFSSLMVAETWLAGPHRFPVITPKKLLEEFAAANGLACVASFSEIYGNGTVDYFVWRMVA